MQVRTWRRLLHQFDELAKQDLQGGTVSSRSQGDDDEDRGLCFACSFGGCALQAAIKVWGNGGTLVCDARRMFKQSITPKQR